MANKLRDIFDKSPEANEYWRNRAEEIKQQLIADHHCSYCKNCTKVPHIEMGYDAGTDPFCNIYQKLMLDYEAGSECLFWEEKKC